MATRKSKPAPISTQVETPEVASETELEAEATPEPLKTEPRIIGDETHAWSAELGGIPRDFGPPPKSEEAASEVVIVEETPTAPRAGKVPVDPLAEIALGDETSS